MGRKIEVVYPKCAEKRKCFAKVDGRCEILRCPDPHDWKKTPFPRGECPFCKPEREVTKGVRYPYNPDYGSGKEGET